MALGLSGLTDDQLFELLKEACDEMAQRDPYMRECAQKAILDRGEKLKEQRAALDKAIEDVRKQYIEGIWADVHKDVVEKVASGEIRILAPNKEALAIMQADQAAREGIKKMLAEKGKGPIAFSVSVREGSMILNMGSFKLEGRSRVSAGEAQALIEQLMDF